ncbi:MAG: hypothetical protein JJV89_01705 [Desulfosarcina sp.]|nr:hypothetical protein [Desulfobacterales bacterium]
MAFHHPDLENLLHAVQIAKMKICDNVVGHKKERIIIVNAIIDIEQATYKIINNENAKIEKKGHQNE